MARRGKLRIVSVEDEDDDEGLIMRDYAMARLAAAIAALENAKNACVDTVSLFMTPDDDKRGKERKELVDEAIELASIATRALEDAAEKFGAADLEAGEPWEEEDPDPESAS